MASFLNHLYTVLAVLCSILEGFTLVNLKEPSFEKSEVRTISE